MLLDLIALKDQSLLRTGPLTELGEKMEVKKGSLFAFRKTFWVEQIMMSNPSIPPPIIGATGFEEGGRVSLNDAMPLLNSSGLQAGSSRA